MCDSFLENAVVVQLEEQATVISILENKKLVFQRVTPYGYGATITAVIDHPVLGIDDDCRLLVRCDGDLAPTAFGSDEIRVIPELGTLA